jgi:hypothetical protein
MREKTAAMVGRVTTWSGEDRGFIGFVSSEVAARRCQYDVQRRGAGNGFDSSAPHATLPCAIDLHFCCSAAYVWQHDFIPFYQRLLP